MPHVVSPPPSPASEVFTTWWTTENWFIQQHTGNHLLCMGLYSKVASINHWEPQALINPDTPKILKPKGCLDSFFPSLSLFFNNSVDGKTWPAVMWGYLLSLFFPLSVTVRHFPAEKLIGLIIEHCPRLHQGYYRIYSICNPFPFKHPKTQIPKHIWPQGTGWWIEDMHLLFPWDSCNHSYCSLQPKDTENWCLPITEWLFISLWKNSIYCWDPSNKISFPLFYGVNISNIYL
jgi:hypothetical protein